MRKFKVVTRITNYVWAESPEDARKFHEDLIRKGKVTLEKDGETTVKFSRALGVQFLEAPEDISKSRDPIEKPRPLDWLEIEQDGMSLIALVTKLSKRRVYYYEALTQTQRSIDRDAWAKWAGSHKVHPSYQEKLPPFIIHECVRIHREKGLISDHGGTPDSSVILATLEKYGYEPDDYELQNGYWAENILDKELNNYILETSSKAGPAAPGDEVDEWDIQLGDDLPTLDELSK
ncbi:hypothetical protein [Cerasicoccus frondis]|uniref:hypothetical protein n=1 Tax=Cerasicoccus frondis TaxID=490090 RepID=UPI002852524D|nr:hypothetical protein [Cerasicoccus frondis]